MKKPRDPEETEREQLKTAQDKKSGPVSRCQMEVQLIQNAIWDKKRKAVSINKLIL